MANRLLLILLTIFISASSFATPVEQDLIKSASDAFQKAFPKDNGQEDYNEGADSLGDINNDGVTDFVTLLYTPDKDPNERGDTQIAVFLGNKEGSFSLYKLSGSTFPHERYDQRVTIGKGSIFFYRRGGIPCCGEDVFQFKLRAKNIVLIGSEISEFVGDDVHQNDFGKSINFITGDVMYWRQTMKKRKEIKAKFKPPALIKIEDFSYPVGEPKGAEGYIDEKFNFVK